MTFVSYAQNGEDVVLWRVLQDVAAGFYIDIGACHPSELSVTKAFYDRGWRGINVEPVRNDYERLLEERPRDINLNVAVAAKPGRVRFKRIDRLGLSTMVDSVADRARQDGLSVETIDVPALSLADICADAACTDIHFLKIDVEGAERDVLEGADFARFHPWIIVIEATVPNSPARSDHLWGDLLDTAGYERVLFDGLNLFFLSREHRHLRDALSVPANVHDTFIPARLQAAEQRLLRCDKDRADAAARQARFQDRPAGVVTEAMRSAQDMSDALAVLRVERDRAQSTIASLEVRLDQNRAEALDLSHELAGRTADLAEARSTVEDLRSRLDHYRLEQDAIHPRLNRAEDENKRLSLRLDQQSQRERGAVDRLKREIRDARRQVADLEYRRADSQKLQEIEALLETGLLAVLQNGGLEILQRSFSARVGAWRAEMARDQAELASAVADLQARLAAAIGQRRLVLASTSWRITAPLRGLADALQMIRREPGRLPGLVLDWLRGRQAGSRDDGPPSLPPGGGAWLVPAADRAVLPTAELLARTAATIEAELTILSELLQIVSAIIVRVDHVTPEAGPRPGSDLYRSMDLNRQLASWIRFDMTRQRSATH